MWNAKKFNTLVFQDFLNEPLDTYIISQYINDSPRVEYMSNFAISLVNEINCGIISIEEWLMYVFMKCLIDGSLGELKDLNSISKLKDYAIFKKRKFIKGIRLHFFAIRTQCRLNLQRFNRNFNCRKNSIR